MDRETARGGGKKTRATNIPRDCGAMKKSPSGSEASGKAPLPMSVILYGDFAFDWGTGNYLRGADLSKK
jgi:hypothetical protein